MYYNILMCVNIISKQILDDYYTHNYHGNMNNIMLHCIWDTIGVIWKQPAQRLNFKTTMLIQFLCLLRSDNSNTWHYQ